jgi:polysaccharide export outer membrane protein
MKYRYLSAIFSLLAFGTIAGAQVVDTSPAKNSVLGPGDEIAGKVVGESEYDFAAFVNEDGYVEVPFSKEPVLAKCRTERELRLDLTERLSKYLKNPQFSFRVVNRNSRPPTTIAGEVNNPQQVVLMRKVTLFELLSFAGGPKEETANGVIQVFRPQAPMCPDSDESARWKADNGDPLQIPSRTYHLSDVRVGNEESNPVIYPGDVVMVQRAAPVYITGEVQNSMGIYLKDGGLTLSEAVAKVGGFHRDAKTKDIKIQRKNPQTGKRDILSVNYDLVRKGQQDDIALQPEDIIIVGVAKDSIAKTILGIAMGAARTTINAAAAAGPYRVIY